MNPFAELDELIAAGWGDVPQTKIPADWRELSREQEPELAPTVIHRKKRKPYNHPRRSWASRIEARLREYQERRLAG